MPRRGVRKYFSKPKKGCRPYGALKNWRYSKHEEFSTEVNNKRLNIDATEHTEEHVLRDIDQPSTTSLCIDHKPKIRVVSLFDGISCGLVVLSQHLGLGVEVYFSSEIHPDALKVQMKNFGKSITPVGDVTFLSSETLAEMGPVNLLLAGSPCNDFSKCNPKRRGLYDEAGDGILFFDFLRIRDFFIADSERKGHTFHWLFENVPNMDVSVSTEINQYLQMSPIKLIPSTSERARHFWGNTPRFQENHMTSRDPFIPLQRFLLRDRVANVDILPTLTSNANSQYSGGTLAPVAENGIPDKLDVIEFERVLGLEDHFTNVGNLCMTRRWALLGKSWEIGLVAKILQPLQDIYKQQDLFSLVPPQKCRI